MTSSTVDIDAEIEKAFMAAGINTKAAEDLNFVTLDDDFQSTQFRGTNLDLLFGMIYIFSKYDSGCLPMNVDIKAKKFDLFNELGINWTCAKNGQRKLTIPTGIVKNFFKCRARSDVRYIFILLTLVSQEGCSKRKRDNNDWHANLLIYDTKSKMMERFEPNGCIVERDRTTSGKKWFWYDVKEFDKKMEVVARDLFNAEYDSARINCPLVGLQKAQDNENISIWSDPDGFCAAWTLFIIQLRLKNPDKNLNEIQLLAIKKIKKSPRELTTFIRSFSQFIVKKRKEIYNKFSAKTIKLLERTDGRLINIPPNEVKKINKVIFDSLKKLKHPIVKEKKSK